MLLIYSYSKTKQLFINHAQPHDFNPNLLQTPFDPAVILTPSALHTQLKSLSLFITPTITNALMSLAQFTQLALDTTSLANIDFIASPLNPDAMLCSRLVMPSFKLYSENLYPKDALHPTLISAEAKDYLKSYLPLALSPTSFISTSSTSDIYFNTVNRAAITPIDLNQVQLTGSMISDIEFTLAVSNSALLSPAHRNFLLNTSQTRIPSVYSQNHYIPVAKFLQFSTPTPTNYNTITPVTYPLYLFNNEHIATTVSWRFLAKYLTILRKQQPLDILLLQSVFPANFVPPSSLPGSIDLVKPSLRYEINPTHDPYAQLVLDQRQLLTAFSTTIRSTNSQTQPMLMQTNDVITLITSQLLTDHHLHSINTQTNFRIFGTAQYKYTIINRVVSMYQHTIFQSIVPVSEFIKALTLNSSNVSAMTQIDTACKMFCDVRPELLSVIDPQQYSTPSLNTFHTIISTLGLVCIDLRQLFEILVTKLSWVVTKPPIVASQPNGKRWTFSDPFPVNTGIKERTEAILSSIVYCLDGLLPSHYAAVQNRQYQPRRLQGYQFASSNPECIGEFDALKYQADNDQFTPFINSKVALSPPNVSADATTALPLIQMPSPLPTNLFNTYNTDFDKYYDHYSKILANVHCKDTCDHNPMTSNPNLSYLFNRVKKALFNLSVISNNAILPNLLFDILVFLSFSNYVNDLTFSASINSTNILQTMLFQQRTILLTTPQLFTVFEVLHNITLQPTSPFAHNGFLKQ
jgi:hypothetical protein